MLLKLIYKKPSDNTQPYPDGYVYEPDVDEAMRSEIEDVWRDIMNQNLILMTIGHLNLDR